MDYLTLSELGKDVTKQMAMRGTDPEYYALWKNYKDTLKLHFPEKPTNGEADVPEAVLDAFIPVWDMHQQSVKLSTGKRLPGLPL